MKQIDDRSNFKLELETYCDIFDHISLKFGIGVNISPFYDFEVISKLPSGQSDIDPEQLTNCNTCNKDVQNKIQWFSRCPLKLNSFCSFLGRHNCLNRLICSGCILYLSCNFGPQVYLKGSLVIALVRRCVCPSVYKYLRDRSLVISSFLHEVRAP